MIKPEVLTVGSIDLLTHPAYAFKYSGRKEPTQSELNLKEGWIKRARERASDQNAFLQVPSWDEHDPIVNEAAFRWEQELTDILQGIYKKRHILLPSWDTLNQGEIEQVLQERAGLTIDPSSTELHAYGLYYNQCTPAWNNNIRRITGIKLGNGLPELSMASEGSPMAAQFAVAKLRSMPTMSKSFPLSLLNRFRRAA